MALANFPILSPQQANPMFNALQNMQNMQQIRQQGFENQYLPQMLQQKMKQAQLQTKYMPDILQAKSQGGNPLLRLITAALQHYHGLDAHNFLTGTMGSSGVAPGYEQVSLKDGRTVLYNPKTQDVKPFVGT